MPGTPLTVDMAQMNPGQMASPDDIKRFERLYGLDKPWYEAYFIWLGNVVRGDFGRSIPQEQPAGARLIIEPAAGDAAALGDVAGADLSVLDAARPVVDRQERHVWPSGRSARSSTCSTRCRRSWRRFILQLLFYSKLGWLPLFGMTSDNFATLSTGGKVWDLFQHALLPIICFTYGSLAYYSRFIRANMQEVIRQDYIRTAKAKGVPPRRVLWHHAFRNTLIPLVTLIGLTLPALLERRGDPRADLHLARHGAAVLRIDLAARLPHAHGPDADVQRADARRPAAGRHAVRGGRSAGELLNEHG